MKYKEGQWQGDEPGVSSQAGGNPSSGPVPVRKNFIQSNPNFISSTSDSINFSILSCGTLNRDKKVLSKMNVLNSSILKQAIKAIFNPGLLNP
jgi:hypothetical protein